MFQIAKWTGLIIFSYSINDSSIHSSPSYFTSVLPTKPHEPVEWRHLPATEEKSFLYLITPTHEPSTYDLHLTDTPEDAEDRSDWLQRRRSAPVPSARIDEMSEVALGGPSAEEWRRRRAVSSGGPRLPNLSEGLETRRYGMIAQTIDQERKHQRSLSNESASRWYPSGPSSPSDTDRFVDMALPLVPGRVFSGFSEGSVEAEDARDGRDGDQFYGPSGMMGQSSIQAASNLNGLSIHNSKHSSTPTLDNSPLLPDQVFRHNTKSTFNAVTPPSPALTPSPNPSLNNSPKLSTPHSPDIARVASGERQSGKDGTQVGLCSQGPSASTILSPTRQYSTLSTERPSSSFDQTPRESDATADSASGSPLLLPSPVDVIENRQAMSFGGVDNRPQWHFDSGTPHFPPLLLLVSPFAALSSLTVSHRHIS